LKKAQFHGAPTFRASQALFRWGPTREEVERLIQQAVELHMAGLAEEGLPIPPPSSFAGEIKVHSAA